MPELLSPPVYDSAPSCPVRRDPFCGYDDVREIVNGLYAASKDGEAVVLRIISARQFADPRHQIRFASNLDRAADLDHEAIASVVGRGLSGEGRPFIARRHITGVPIDVYARGEAFGMASVPTLGNLLRLFIRVCQAVQFAHQSGVLHGNVKPANVLIDADGQPQIVDFGVSLAPAGESRDDVVALGRILFDLLRDRPVAVEPALSAIAARATSPDRNRSYASADALADDLDAYLLGNPLSFDPPDVGSTLVQWTFQQITRPAIPLVIGLVAGWLIGIGAWSGTFFLVSLAVASLALMGMLAARFGCARTWAGASIAGVSCGLVAGFLAWTCGSGTAIAGRIMRSATSDLDRIVAVSGTRGDQLLKAHPELAAWPENERLAALATRVRDRVSASAGRAMILGTAIPWAVCLAAGILGAWAYFGTRASRWRMAM